MRVFWLLVVGFSLALAGSTTYAEKKEQLAFEKRYSHADYETLKARTAEYTARASVANASPKVLARADFLRSLLRRKEERLRLMQWSWTLHGYWHFGLLGALLGPILLLLCCCQCRIFPFGANYLSDHFKRDRFFTLNDKEERKPDKRTSRDYWLHWFPTLPWKLQKMIVYVRKDKITHRPEYRLEKPKTTYGPDGALTVGRPTPNTQVKRKRMRLAPMPPGDAAGPPERIIRRPLIMHTKQRSHARYAKKVTKRFVKKHRTKIVMKATKFRWLIPKVHFNRRFGYQKRRRLRLMSRRAGRAEVKLIAKWARAAARHIARSAARRVAKRRAAIMIKTAVEGAHRQIEQLLAAGGLELIVRRGSFTSGGKFTPATAGTRVTVKAGTTVVHNGAEATLASGSSLCTLDGTRVVARKGALHVAKIRRGSGGGRAPAARIPAGTELMVRCVRVARDGAELAIEYGTKVIVKEGGAKVALKNAAHLVDSSSRSTAKGGTELTLKSGSRLMDRDRKLVVATEAGFKYAGIGQTKMHSQESRTEKDPVAAGALLKFAGGKRKVIKNRMEFTIKAGSVVAVKEGTTVVLQAAAELTTTTGAKKGAAAGTELTVKQGTKLIDDLNMVIVATKTDFKQLKQRVKAPEKRSNLIEPGAELTFKGRAIVHRGDAECRIKDGTKVALVEGKRVVLKESVEVVEIREGADGKNELAQSGSELVIKNGTIFRDQDGRRVIATWCGMKIVRNFPNRNRFLKPTKKMRTQLGMNLLKGGVELLVTGNRRTICDKDNKEFVVPEMTRVYVLAKKGAKIALMDRTELFERDEKGTVKSAAKQVAEEAARFTVKDGTWFFARNGTKIVARKGALKIVRKRYPKRARKTLKKLIKCKTQRVFSPRRLARRAAKKKRAELQSAANRVLATAKNDAWQARKNMSLQLAAGESVGEFVFEGGHREVIMDGAVFVIRPGTPVTHKQLAIIVLKDDAELTGKGGAKVTVKSGTELRVATGTRLHQAPPGDIVLLAHAGTLKIAERRPAEPPAALRVLGQPISKDGGADNKYLMYGTELAITGSMRLVLTRECEFSVPEGTKFIVQDGLKVILKSEKPTLGITRDGITVAIPISTELSVRRGAKLIDDDGRLVIAEAGGFVLFEAKTGNAARKDTRKAIKEIIRGFVKRYAQTHAAYLKMIAAKSESALRLTRRYAKTMAENMLGNRNAKIILQERDKGAAAKKDRERRNFKRRHVLARIKTQYRRKERKMFKRLSLQLAKYYIRHPKKHHILHGLVPKPEEPKKPRPAEQQALPRIPDTAPKSGRIFKARPKRQPPSGKEGEEEEEPKEELKPMEEETQQEGQSRMSDNPDKRGKPDAPTLVREEPTQHATVMVDELQQFLEDKTQATLKSTLSRVSSTSRQPLSSTRKPTASQMTQLASVVKQPSSRREKPTSQMTQLMSVHHSSRTGNAGSKQATTRVTSKTGNDADEKTQKTQGDTEPKSERKTIVKTYKERTSHL